MIWKWIPWRTVALTALIGAIVGLAMQGSFMQQIVALGIVVWVLGPLALFLVLAGLMTLRRDGDHGWLANVGLFWFYSFLAIAVSMLVGDWVNRYQVHAAKTYVDEALPVLDAFHEDQGHYPETLAEAGLESPPKLLREPGGYTGTVHTFRFELWDPSKLMSGQQIVGDDREWRAFD
jgi:hypothetical protein